MPGSARRRPVPRWGAAFLGLTLLGGATPSTPQDLAAAARKEKERRAKVATPSKILTEQDAKNAAVKGTGSVSTMSGGAAPAEAEPVTSPDSERAVWKRRADGAREELGAAEVALRVAEETLARHRSDQEALTADEARDPMRLQKREAVQAAMIKEVQAKKDALALAKKALEDLETEARRSGIPAGWLR